MLGVQDFVNCGLCKEEVVERICEICNVNLCKNCIGCYVINNDGLIVYFIVKYKD